jgi:transcriptional regulator with GAF, ATPase, and Fis domain
VENNEPSGECTTALYSLPGNNDNDEIGKLLDNLGGAGKIDSGTLRTAVRELEMYRRNNRLLKTLYSLLIQVLSILDRDEAVTLLLRQLRTLLGLEISSLYLVEENRFGILEEKGIEWSGEYPVVSRKVLNRVVESRQPVVIDDVDGDDTELKTLVKFKIRQVLCFPVLNREEQVLAVVYCVSRNTGELGILKDDTQFIEACSVVIALVLENLRMLEREKSAAYKSAKERQTRKFTPIIRRLRQQRENLSLKLGTLEEEFVGLDGSEGEALRQFIERAAPTGLPILITGETGVGKSLFARAIHRSHQKNSPFVTIDCTTIPHGLLESELFGHEKGAFTGAHAGKPGKVSAADGGTLFIDEIGELDAKLQAKLLRFIQTGDYEPLGGSATFHSSARVITATNRDLKAEVTERRFREDLYYRLNVLALELPPLRDRADTILMFAGRFLARYAPRLNPAVKGFTAGAEKILVAHRWPGNIRELENTIMRALVNCRGDRISAEDCAIEMDDRPVATADREAVLAAEGAGMMDLKAARERIDRILISRALDSTGRNVSRSADLLMISRNSLMDLIKKYGL